jgi:hypothetical protein
MKEIEMDFTYIDKHLDMIKSKIKTYGTISIFNGFYNIIFIIKKDNDDYIYETLYKNNNIVVTYNEIVETIMLLYKGSVGKITLIYRIFTSMHNKNTKGEFRELWGDILYIDADTFKLKAENIDAKYLSSIVVDLKLTDEEIELFGRPEDYVFKDDNDNIIMGIDLL